MKDKIGLIIRFCNYNDTISEITQHWLFVQNEEIDTYYQNNVIKVKIS